MPFKSEAQRRYMWATMPAIAAAWEKEEDEEEKRKRERRDRDRMRRLTGKE